MRVLVLALLLLALPVLAAESTPDPTREAEQAVIESGDDLSSRSQRVLFRTRNRQADGDHAGAVELLDEWLAGAADRDHHLLRFTRATSLLVLERPADAAVDLKQAVLLNPRFARAWLRLGEASHGAGDAARAGEAFLQAYDLAPQRRPELLYYAGASLLSAGRGNDACDALLQLVDAYPAVPELSWYQALAAAAADAGRAAEARPRLERLVRANPDDPAAWDLAYRHFAGQADYERAAVHLAVVGHLRELTAAEHEQLGDLYAVVGVPLQAARHYEQAFAAASEPDADAYRKLATAWLTAHETAAARATLERALAAVPDVDLWALKGDLEYGVEEYGAAVDAYAAAVAADPDFGRGHLMLGYCAFETGDEAAARGHLARALEFPAQESAARSLLGRIDLP